MQKFKLDAISGDLWVPLPRRASKEGCQWQRLCSAELSVKPCWTSRAGCQEWVGKQYLLGTSTQSPPGPQPCPWATQIRGQLAGSSSVKNRIGSLTSDSGCGGQPSRPLDTWPQESPAIFPGADIYCQGFSLILPKVLAIECLLQRLGEGHLGLL